VKVVQGSKPGADKLDSLFNHYGIGTRTGMTNEFAKIYVFVFILW